MIDTTKFLDKLYENKVHTIFASSIAARNPKSSMYALSKYYIEQYINKMNYNRFIHAVRLSNVYGGINFLNKSTVISTFIKNIQNNIPLNIHGNGTQLRDFVHVEYVCEVFLEILNNKFAEYDVWARRNTLELGSGTLITIKELSNIFKDLFKCDVQINPDISAGIYSMDSIDISWIDDLYLYKLNTSKLKIYSLNEYISECI